MKIPLKEVVQSIPGFLGIRLEEEPPHELLVDDGAFQIRRYVPMVVAKVTVGGDPETALDRGFEILANYIFGGNHAKTQLSMTTPVLQSETLSMTTPVLQEKSGEGWTIAFVLPSECTKETAPIPNDTSIKIESVSSQTVAVYRYNGNNTNEARSEAQNKLTEYLRLKGINAKSSARFAQYDQPFAIPYFKRNEVHIEVSLK